MYFSENTFAKSKSPNLLGLLHCNWMRLLFTLSLSFFLFHPSAHADSIFPKVKLIQSVLPLALNDTIKKVVFRKNIIKMNLSSLLLYNNSLSYERSLTRKITLVAGYRYMPRIRTTTSYLGRKLFENYEKNDEQQLADDLHSTYLGNNTLTGEIRFYAGKNPGARGFYLSLYGRYMDFNLAFPYEHETESRIYTIPFNGKVTALAGGLMIGSQWLIAKRVTLDWHILGGHFGKLKIDMPGKADLSSMTSDEKRILQEDLEVVNIGIDRNAKVDVNVSDNGAQIRGSLPFFGVRGFGLSLGIAF